MASVVVTLKIMPEGVDTDLAVIREKAEHLIDQFGGTVGKFETMPVAFGLKSLTLMFVMDEAIGSTEELEKDIAAVPGVNSVECTDVRRTIG